MNTGFSLLGSISELFSSRTSNSKPRVDNKENTDVFKNSFEDKLKSSRKRVDEDKYESKNHDKDVDKLDSKKDKTSYEKENNKVDDSKKNIDRKDVKKNSNINEEEISDKAINIEGKEILKIDNENIVKIEDLSLEELNLEEEDLQELASVVDQLINLDEDVDKTQLMVLVDSLKEIGVDLQNLGIDADLTNKIEDIINPKMFMSMDSLNNSNTSNEDLNLEIEDLKNLDDGSELEELKTIIKNLKEQLKNEQTNVEGKEFAFKENVEEIAVTNKDVNTNLNNIGNLMKETAQNGQIEFDDLDFEQGDSKEDSNTNMASSIKFSSNISKTGTAKVNPTFENMVLKQVTEEIKLNVKKDISTLEMKLEPETLGKVTLRIALEKGVLNIKVLAEDDKVKETLENNIEELKSVLEEQGLSVDNLEVSVNDDSEFRRHRDILRAMSLNKSNSKNNFTLFDEEELSIEDIKNPYLNDDEFNEFA